MEWMKEEFEWLHVKFVSWASGCSDCTSVYTCIGFFKHVHLFLTQANYSQMANFCSETKTTCKFTGLISLQCLKCVAPSLLMCVWRSIHLMRNVRERRLRKKTPVVDLQKSQIVINSVYTTALVNSLFLLFRRWKSFWQVYSTLKCL